MPYIKQERREKIGYGEVPRNAGELNFTITVIINNYLMNQGGKRYVTINEIVGVLECAKLEFYRRLAAPYEDVKIAENGDVYC